MTRIFIRHFLVTVAVTVRNPFYEPIRGGFGDFALIAIAGTFNEFKLTFQRIQI